MALLSGEVIDFPGPRGAPRQAGAQGRKQGGELAHALLQRHAAMKSARAVFDIMWQQVRDNINPVSARFVGEDPVGVPSNQFTIDETPEQAHELLAAALHGMITNPALTWIEIEPSDAHLLNDDACQTWCVRARDVLVAQMYSGTSGLIAAHHETYLDLTAYGTAVLFTGEQVGTGLIYRCCPLQECYLAEGANGQIDTTFRYFRLTARAAVQRWGDAAGPLAVKKAGELRGQDHEMEFLHAVYPRSDRAAEGRFGGMNLAVASVYVAVADKHVIRESGYHEMPYACPRWIKRANEKNYGRGAGTKALPSTKALQRTMKITLDGAALAIRPPMMVADDGVMSPISLRAAALHHVRADMLAGNNTPIRPILTGANPQIGEETMEGMRNRIQASFYNHLLQMSRDPRMTATQVIQIAEETLRILGPMVGRISDEMLEPHVGRSFALCMRAGAFPPMPPQMRGRAINIKFNTPIGQGQKLSEAKGIVQTFGVATQLAQAKPDIMDNYDIDGAARELAVMFGMPRYLLNDPRVVADMRAERARQQQQQGLVEGAPMMANAIKNAAQALPAIREGLGFAPDQGDQSAAA